jgi:16S rRNA G527 N7-methylase RsmG
LPSGIDYPSVIDVGSGGGLPGLVLAIACPDLSVTLVDAVREKTAFLHQAAIEPALRNVTVHHARVENLHGVTRLSPRAPLRNSRILSRSPAIFSRRASAGLP